jgi:hypothetical protein
LRASKGQVSGLDLTLGMVLVLFIMLSAYDVWGSTVSKMDAFQSHKALDDRLRDVSQLLVRTSGDPANWSSTREVDGSRVKSIGFAMSDNVLDYRRIEKAQAMDYDDLKEIMGLGKEELYVTVTELESGDKNVYYRIGRAPQWTRASANRYALLNGTIVEVKVSLYYGNETDMTT